MTRKMGCFARKRAPFGAGTMLLACAFAGACGTAPHGFGDSSLGDGGTSGPNGVSSGGGDGPVSDSGSSDGPCDGSCSPVTGPDGGKITIPDAGDIYNTPTVCTSGTTWTLGDQKSSDMKPGSECQTCHVLGGDASGKQFDIAGTVYPTAHEPDDCNGATGASVIITDKNGGTTSLTVTAAGNFYHDDAVGFFKIATPYTAVVSAGGKTRPMITPQTDGNCNHCHSLTGDESAPGHVMMP